MLFTHNKEEEEAKPKSKASQQHALVVVRLCCHSSAVYAVYFTMTLVSAGQFLSCEGMQRHCNILMAWSMTVACSWLLSLPNTAVAGSSEWPEPGIP